jgi:thiol-disulfide isomerase/thioredoxin
MLGRALSLSSARVQLPAARAAAALGPFRCFSVINLSDESAVEKFSTVNQKSVVYYTATWCGPCKMIKPIYEEMASKYSSVAFGKVDIDENQDAAITAAVNSVPTFILYEGKEPMVSSYMLLVVQHFFFSLVSLQERFSGADAGKLQELVEKLSNQ